MGLSGEDVVVDIKRQVPLFREEQIEVLEHLSQEEGVHPENAKRIYKVSQIYTGHSLTNRICRLNITSMINLYCIFFYLFFTARLNLFTTDIKLPLQMRL